MENCDNMPNTATSVWVLLQRQAEYDLKLASEKVRKLKIAIKSFKRSAESGESFPQV
jgi:hypothetical protein